MNFKNIVWFIKAIKYFFYDEIIVFLLDLLMALTSIVAALKGDLEHLRFY